MKFQIVSDSSCDLPKERAQELGVDIVPFYVSFEEENYMKEGVDISVEDFYQMMADRAGTFPKTSMPSFYQHRVFKSTACRWKTYNVHRKLTVFRQRAETGRFRSMKKFHNDY